MMTVPKSASDGVGSGSGSEKATALGEVDLSIVYVGILVANVYMRILQALAQLIGRFAAPWEQEASRR